MGMYSRMKTTMRCHRSHRCGIFAALHSFGGSVFDEVGQLTPLIRLSYSLTDHGTWFIHNLYVSSSLFTPRHGVNRAIRPFHLGKGKSERSG